VRQLVQIRSAACDSALSSRPFRRTPFSRYQRGCETVWASQVIDPLHEQLKRTDASPGIGLVTGKPRSHGTCPRARELGIRVSWGQLVGRLATYQFLGSWAVASDQGQGSKELHVVYASPGTVTAYRRDGGFPDGAVLVKEVFQTATAEMTTGIVSHAETLKGWFVMVKDGDGRYSGNRLWGDGWGWSWFDAANPSKTTSTDYKTDCRSCHVPAQPSDWIYVDGYPPLKR
jgi:Cytochrome P460